MKAHSEPLGEVCEINPATDLQFRPNDLCTFVPMEAVDDVDARIEKPTTRPFREVAKGYTPFAENDVIIAKITPCMENGKCALARNLRNGIGFGSTEFHVLRGTKHVIPEWLYYFWRFPATRKLAATNMTGSAGQKRVPATFLEGVKIPLPPVPQQQRLVADLTQADHLRRTRRYALGLTDSLFPAAFILLFGDITTHIRRWKNRSFRELLVQQPRNGLSPSTKGKCLAKVLTLSAITGDVFDPDASKTAPFLAEPPQDVRVSATDYLVCRGNGNLALVGRGKFPPKDMADCVFPDTMIAVRVNSDWICRPYLEAVWKTPTLRKQIESAARTTNGTHKINQEALEDLQLPVPPLSLQSEFATLVERVERLRAVQRESLRQAEHLFATLLHRAFS